MLQSEQEKPISDRRLLSAEALERLRHVLINLFSQGLFHQVGIRDICSQAKVSPKTVYKYFGNKDQLLEACVESDLQDLSDLSREAINQAVGSKAKLRAQVEVILSFYQSRPEVARMVFLNIPTAYWLRSASKAHAEHQLLGQEIFRQGVAESLMRDDLPSLLVNEMISGSVNRVISRWVHDGLEDSLAEQSEACFQFIWRSIAIQP